MLSLNMQPAEKPDLREDGSLDVHSVFKTIQGEGPLAGTPAIFVRLAGCSLQCPGCDTEYTSKRERMSPELLFDRIIPLLHFGRGIELIVITGGEPFRQNLIPFCNLAIARGWTIQIETNGVHAPSAKLHDDVSIVCSPKTPKIHPDLEYRIDAYKYVLSAGAVDPFDGLPTDVLRLGHRPARPSLVRSIDDYSIFVQPMDEGDVDKNRWNVEAAVQSCMQFGYQYSHQIHKLIGLE